ncbi:MAG: hypothetical protein CMK00_08665 [Planctomycetes bacterium]|nr:hypothetical protein [Planctomycetota bacterium]
MARDLVAVLVLAGLGAPPLVMGGTGSLGLLVWLALVAMPVGVMAGGLGLRLWPAGWAVPGLWMILLALVESRAGNPLPTAPWAVMAWFGLFAVGFSLGHLRPEAVWTRAACSLASCALASGLLTLWGWGAGHSAGVWPAQIGASLLDISPVALVTECAGLDWMRHPAVYQNGGTAHMGPELRTAWQGSLAGPGVFLFGCLALGLSGRSKRRPRVPEKNPSTVHRPAPASQADSPAD